MSIFLKWEALPQGKQDQLRNTYGLKFHYPTEEEFLIDVIAKVPETLRFELGLVEEVEPIAVPEEVFVPVKTKKKKK